MTLISIITPSFNQGKFLEENLHSIAKQQQKGFEIEHIIIDGQSEDNSVEIIKKHEKHLAYWISEKDNGQSHAINKGLKHATGDIITWLNSDDFYEPDTLEYVLTEFQNNPGVSVIHGKTLLFGDSIKSVINGLETNIKPSQYLPYMRFPQPSSFFKAEVFRKNGTLNNNLHYAMDFELVVKAVLSGFRFLRSDKLLSHYRIHNNSKSNHDMKFLNEWETVFCKALASLHNGQQWLDVLNEFGINNKMSDERYNCQISFTDFELEEAVLEHLYIQYHYHYKSHNKVFCTQLNNWLKQNYPSFYNKRSFNKYHIRQNYLPKAILKLGRKLLG